MRTILLQHDGHKIQLVKESIGRTFWPCEFNYIDIYGTVLDERDFEIWFSGDRIHLFRIIEENEDALNLINAV